MATDETFCADANGCFARLPIATDAPGSAVTKNLEPYPRFSSPYSSDAIPLPASTHHSNPRITPPRRLFLIAALALATISSSLPLNAGPPATTPTLFQRGEANADGSFDIADVLFGLFYLDPASWTP